MEGGRSEGAGVLTKFTTQTAHHHHHHQPGVRSSGSAISDDGVDVFCNIY